MRGVWRRGGLSVLAWLAAVYVPATSGANLFPGDSSFETGVGKAVQGSCGGGVSWEIDPTDGADGRQSLKLWYRRQDWVQSEPFVVSQEQAGRTFTFSLYAKAETDGVDARLYLIRTDWSHGHHGTVFKLTRDWQRHTLTGPLKAGGYWLGFQAKGPCVAWVDAYQIEEGTAASPYGTHEPLSLGITLPSKSDYVFFPGEEVPITVAAAVRAGETAPAAATLSLKVTDYYGNTVLEDPASTVVWTDGRHCRRSVVFSPPALGFYLVQAALSEAGGQRPGAACTASLACVQPPEAIKEGTLPFCGSFSTMAGLQRIGSRWSEVCTHWRDLEPQPGQYTWPGITAAKEAGCRMKLTIAHLPSVPSWAEDPAAVADCKAKGMAVPRFGFLPARERLPDWQRLIRRLAEQYGDQVDLWEIGGEDDLTFGQNPYYTARSPEHVRKGLLTGGPDFELYAEMVRLACLEIRRALPGARIGIVRPSGVDCTDVKPRFTFTEPVIRHCAEVFDLLPLDCYCYPRYLGPGQPAVALPDDFLPEDFDAALAACARSGKGQEVYVSEFGYAMDYNVRPDSEYAREMVKRLVRTHLIARSTKGVHGVHWFHPNGCVEGGVYHYGLWRFGMPLPTVPAYSAVARVVENVAEARTVPLGGNLTVAVFRKDDRADAAVWMKHGEGKLVCPGLPKGTQVMDVMGNPAPTVAEGAAMVVAIGEFPVYLRLAGGGAFAALDQALSQARVRCRPVTTRLLTPRVDQAVLQLQNQLAEDLVARATVRVDGGPSTRVDVPVGKAAVASTTIALPAGLATRPAMVQVEVDCGDGQEKAVSTHAVSFELCRRLAKAIAIDGDVTEWRGRPGTVLRERGQILPPDPWVNWTGPDDLSATLWTAWDADAFYVAATVTDDMAFNRNPAARIWNGDGFQLAFDPLADAGGFASKPAGYDRDDVEIGLALTDQGVVAAQWAGPGQVWAGGRYAVVRDASAKTTCYEARIPWTALGITPRAGTAFGFSFVLFDDDTGTGATYWWPWTPGITGGKTPAQFRKLALGE